MKNKLVLTVLIIFSAIPISFFALEEKNLPIVESQPKMQFTANDFRRRLNTAETFSNTINQETFVFMVGNNLYSPSTNFSDLNYCIDDCMLLKKIFMYCCKIKDTNIFLYENLILKDFKINFTDFVKNISKDSRVIIFYSGHGTRDGSLLFVDGEKLYPAELRAFIDSFGNDTVLILDACYAGNNEGPLEIIEWPFRISCQRIYASLAHQTAKEIHYEDTPYFKGVLPFYNDVLQINSIKGNSYFIAMFGYFFAIYNLGKGENLSFNDIVSYITRESKNYVEYLSKKSVEEPEALVEINQRVNQLPKIEPWYRDLVFNNDSHRFIIFQEKEISYKLKDNFLSLEYQMAAMIPVNVVVDFIKTGISAGIGISYNLSRNWGILGFGLSTGLCYTSSLEEISIPYNLWINPFSFNLRYTTNFQIPFYLLVNVSLGFAFYHFRYDDLSIDEEPGMNFFLSPAIGAGFYLLQKISIHISFNYTMTFFEDSTPNSIVPEIGIFYNFF